MDIVPVSRLLGNLIRKSVETTLGVNVSDHRVILERLAKLTELLWESTISNEVEEKLKNISSDYVCSSMVDGRCIYFSNFLPFGREKFTRTIFIDLGMSAHQRARMLQRLCDILTYRSNPIRDLERVKAAINALNQFNRDLNDVQTRMTGRTNQGSFPSVKDFDWNKQMTELHADMDSILRVSSLIGRMNAFITYGVAGKWYSADAYFKQIRERCEDLREVGIPGYAQLDDFVQRRLAHSMRFIERMYMHHTTVGQRLGELMDSVRTQLQSLQTRRILDTLEKQTDMTEAMQEASTGMGDAAKEISRDLSQQTKLQEIGDILIVVAGTYYVSQMLKNIESLQINDMNIIERYVDSTGDTGMLMVAFVITLLIRIAGIRMIRPARWLFQKVF